MVRWRESVLLFAEEEVEEVVEIGAGRVLAGLVKRIDRSSAGDLGRRAGRGRSPRQAPASPGIGAAHVRSDRPDARWSPAPPAASAARSRGRCTRQGAAVGLAGTRQAALAALAARTRRAGACADRRPRRSRGRRPPGARRRGGAGPGRHPGQQRRHHPRQPGAAAARRGLAGGHRGQPDRRLPPEPRRVARHGAAPPWPDHLHHLGGRRHRQCRPGQLRRRQGRR